MDELSLRGDLLLLPLHGPHHLLQLPLQVHHSLPNVESCLNVRPSTLSVLSVIASVLSVFSDLSGMSVLSVSSVLSDLSVLSTLLFYVSGCPIQ